MFRTRCVIPVGKPEKNPNLTIKARADARTEKFFRSSRRTVQERMLITYAFACDATLSYSMTLVAISVIFLKDFLLAFRRSLPPVMTSCFLLSLT